jgi:hypothetical protein
MTGFFYFYLMNYPDWIKHIDFWINLLGNISALAASSIAVIIFFKNRKKIGNALNAIINYSTQLTLTELRFKITKASELNANDINQKEEVLNIFHDVYGQINGNNKLQSPLADFLKKIDEYILDPKLLNEGTKRQVLSELNEKLRNIDISTINVA